MFSTLRKEEESEVKSSLKHFLEHARFESSQFISFKMDNHDISIKIFAYFSSEGTKSIKYQSAINK